MTAVSPTLLARPYSVTREPLSPLPVRASRSAVGDGTLCACECEWDANGLSECEWAWACEWPLWPWLLACLGAADGLGGALLGPGEGDDDDACDGCLPDDGPGAGAGGGGDEADARRPPAVALVVRRAVVVWGADPPAVGGRKDKAWAGPRAERASAVLRRRRAIGRAAREEGREGEDIRRRGRAVVCAAAVIRGREGARWASTAS